MSWTGSTIADVIARMEQIDAALSRKDGVASFNRLYLAVTKAVLAASASTDLQTPGFLDRLDVVFAGIYFDAEATISSGATCPVAWRPLVEQRAAEREPIQFALAGMNAHINHDLPIAIVQTCKQFGVAPDDDTPEHADYERVNTLLSAVETQVARWFDTGLIADIEEVTPAAVDQAIAMWSIAAAREVAWHQAQLLWSLRGSALLSHACLDVLARGTGLAGRAMLV